jgi:hypothetical protein
MTASRRRGYALAAAVLLGLLSTGTAAAAPSPSGVAPDGRLGIRLLDAPVTRRDDPRARLYIVDSVKPGTTISRRLEISHQAGAGTGTPVTATLYPAPATVTRGGFVFGPEGARNDLTGWTSLSRTSVLLDPGGTADVDVTIAVPRNATAGERYAVLWAQARSGAAGQVTQVNRVGIRVYLDVGPGGEAPTNFAIGAVSATRDATGVPVLTAQVRNTGRRALDVTGSVTLADGPGGSRAGPFPVRNGTTIAIGEQDAVSSVLDKALPDGPWRATVTLQSGTVKHAVTVTLSFHGRPAAPVAAASSGPRLTPVMFAVAAAVLALLVLTLAARSRSRPARA